jgi:hypothetical protein
LKLSQAKSCRLLGAICALLLLVPVSWARPSSHSTAKTPTKKASSKAHTSKASVKKASAKSSRRHKTIRKKKARGQQAIDPDRAREIQAALIREHYLDGDPSGVWDTETKQALVKFQADNGWQTKIVPDSRALIKLGLGPSREGLLNPESAAFSSPHELGVETEIPGGALPQR